VFTYLRYPTIEAPKRIGATAATGAQRCLLRFVLNSSVAESKMALPSSSPYRYSGTLVHKTIESVRRGDCGDHVTPERLLAVWEEHLDSMEQEAKDNGDACWLPIRESVRQLERLRLWTARLAAGQPVHSGKSGPTSTEPWLENEDGTVVGRVDSVSASDGHLALRDFKTGTVLDENGEVLSDYRTQMLIYASLFRATRGQWPDSLELVDKRGTTAQVAFTTESAIEAVKQAKETLEKARSEVGAGGSPESFAALCSMSTETCVQCRHRPACPAFSKSLSEQGRVEFDQNTWRKFDLTGQVERTLDLGNDRYVAVIRCGSDDLTVRGLSALATFGSSSADIASNLPEPGDQLAIFGVAPARFSDTEPQLFNANRDATVYIVPSTL